jgi:uncharacterized membrane protein
VLDLGLAIVHHVLVFGLAVMLAMELAYLRADPGIASAMGFMTLDSGQFERKAVHGEKGRDLAKRR